jgi:hypothetical protein
VFYYGSPSLTRGLVSTLTIATGPCHRCHSRVQVQQNSAPYLTVSWVQVPQNSSPYLTVSFETGFPFRHLLRLPRVRWRYSNPLPHGVISVPSCIELCLICDRRSVGQSVLESGAPFGPMARFVFLSSTDSFFFSFCGALSDDRTCLYFILQSISVQNRGGLTTMCSLFVLTYDPRCHGGGLLSNLHRGSSTTVANIASARTSW